MGSKDYQALEGRCIAMVESGPIRLVIPALLVSQRPPEHIHSSEFLNEYDFFLFSVSSTDLLKIAKFSSRSESPSGIQRIYQEDRAREIGKFISSDHPFFPNSIIINIPLTFDSTYYNSESKMLNVDIPSNSAYVIDGQHRLRAFESEHSKGVSLNYQTSPSIS
jgi:DGQHR domain-containing protein